MCASNQFIIIARSGTLQHTHSKPLSLSFVCCWLSVTLWMHRVAKRTHKRDAMHTFYFIYSRIYVFCILCVEMRENSARLCCVHEAIVLLLLATYETNSTIKHVCVCLVSDCCRRCLALTWTIFYCFTNGKMPNNNVWHSRMDVSRIYVRCTKNTIMPGVSPHSVRGIFVIWNAAVRWLLWYGNMSLRFGGWWLRRQNDIPGR